MKNFLKGSSALLLLTCCIYAGCKKADVKTADNQLPPSNQAAIAKRIGLSIYKSLSSQFGAANNKTNGELRNMLNGYPKCGEYILGNTDRTVTNSDTTRKYFGNSIFTYTCSGETSVPNGYTLNDTLNTIETGNGFNNRYYDVLNYIVKNQLATEGNGSWFTVGGKAYSFARFSANADASGEYHEFSTEYTFIDLFGAKVNNTSRFIMGPVEFVTTQVDFVKETKTTKVSGVMLFLGEDKLQSFFKIEGTESYYQYDVNLLTGEVSGPTFVAGFEYKR